jgi:hypothetical protein
LESSHGHGTNEFGSIDVHSFIEAVVDYEVVHHADTVGFYGVALAVVVVAYFGIVEVGDAAGAAACHGGWMVMVVARKKTKVEGGRVVVIGKNDDEMRSSTIVGRAII